MTDLTDNLAKNLSQVSVSSSNRLLTRSSSTFENRSYVEGLEAIIKGLQEQLCDAHHIIGRQLRELQVLRQAHHQTKTEVCQDVPKGNDFNAQAVWSPISVMDEASSTSLIYSHASTSKLSTQEHHENGSKRTTSLEREACGRSLYPARIQFRCGVGSSRRRLSSLSMSEDARNPSIDQAMQAEPLSLPRSFETTANNGLPRQYSGRSWSSTAHERPYYHVIAGMRSAKHDAENLIQGEPPSEPALTEVTPQRAQQHDDDLAASGSHNPKIPRPTSHAESQATTKASNISEPRKLDHLMQRRENFRASILATLLASTNPHQGNGLEPTRRVASPPAGTKPSSPLPRPTVKVECSLLADAWDQKGVYTGSMDQTTHLPHGHGTMVYALSQTNISAHTVHKYTGDWMQGKYDGLGILQEAGHTYQGPFQNGVKHGSDEATMAFANGRCFVGRFHADNMREGVLQYEDGSYYEGLLENNRRNGFGFYHFSSGDQYEGQWKDDMM